MLETRPGVLGAAGLGLGRACGNPGSRFGFVSRAEGLCHGLYCPLLATADTTGETGETGPAGLGSAGPPRAGPRAWNEI